MIRLLLVGCDLADLSWVESRLGHVPGKVRVQAIIAPDLPAIHQLADQFYDLAAFGQHVCQEVEDYVRTELVGMVIENEPGTSSDPLPDRLG